MLSRLLWHQARKYQLEVRSDGFVCLFVILHTELCARLDLTLDEILTATRIPPHQLKIHRIIGVASSRNLRTFGGSVAWKLAGSELGHFGVFGGSK